MTTRAKNKHTLEEIESFRLPKQYADVLLAAIQKYSRERGIHIDSIFILDGNTDIPMIEIQPTGAVHLFNIFKLYGQMVARDYIAAGKDAFGEIITPDLDFDSTTNSKQ